MIEDKYLVLWDGGLRLSPVCDSIESAREWAEKYVKPGRYVVPDFFGVDAPALPYWVDERVTGITARILCAAERRWD